MDAQPAEVELEDNPDEIEQWQVGKKLKFDLADLSPGYGFKYLEKDMFSLPYLENNAVAVTPDRDQN